MNKLLKVAATNNAAETGGVERTFSVDGVNNFRVTLRRAGPTNPLFMKLSEEIMRPYREAGVDANDIDPIRQREISREVYAKAVIVGWNEEDFGEPYSAEAAIRTMAGSTDFQNWVITQAQSAGNYRVKALGEIAGN